MKLCIETQASKVNHVKCCEKREQRQHGSQEPKHNYKNNYAKLLNHSTGRKI